MKTSAMTRGQVSFPRYDHSVSGQLVGPHHQPRDDVLDAERRGELLIAPSLNDERPPDGGRSCPMDFDVRFRPRRAPPAPDHGPSAATGATSAATNCAPRAASSKPAAGHRGSGSRQAG